MKEIRSTTNYGLFKKMKGNRDIPSARVKKIIKSVKNVGYITNPIIVNENMEVIDGQARVEAFKQLGIPVEFIVHPGAGINECRSLNINQTNWSDRNYIDSFANSGDENYGRFRQLLNDTNAGVSIALCAVANSYTFTGGTSSSMIRGGELKCTSEDYQRAKFELLYIAGLEDVISTVGGRKEYMRRALLYAYRSLNVLQRQELEEVIRKNAHMIPSFTKVDDFLKYFDEFYNKGKTKSKRIHLELQWKTDRM